MKTLKLNYTKYATKFKSLNLSNHELRYILVNIKRNVIIA
jgi:hypothetical protein